MTAAYQPVIIIGAPRSGTNMLRDVLCALPGFGTWPCDEINYIWRHGNAGFPTDEFAPLQATPRVRQYIARRFDRLAASRGATHVVEKTCANSLRVAFVDRVVPQAKYVLLVRDGRDAIASALRRWSAPLDLAYVAQKARFVPLADLPYYAFRYAANRNYRLWSGEKRLATWGPRFSGMREMLAERTLAEVCAQQWRRCVEVASRDLTAIGGDRVIGLRYEDFVARPDDELQRLLDFLGAGATPFERGTAVRDVSSKNRGKWRSALDVETLDRVAPIIDGTLAKFAYLPEHPSRKAA
jgi:hypothetical protein